jgi:hypothetical protein
VCLNETALLMITKAHGALKYVFSGPPDTNPDLIRRAKGRVERSNPVVSIVQVAPGWVGAKTLVAIRLRLREVRANRRFCSWANIRSEPAATDRDSSNQRLVLESAEKPDLLEWLRRSTSALDSKLKSPRRTASEKAT